MNSQETLRDALKRVIALTVLKDFEREFDSMRLIHNPQIRVLPVLPNDPDFKTFNCYAYALGIAGLSRYKEIVERHQDSTLANSIFVSHVLDRNELKEINEQDVTSGDIVFYYANGSLKHGGKIGGAPKTVHSKWGHCEIFEHALWDVPTDYGNSVKYFKAPDAERMIDLLKDYVEQRFYK